MAFASLTPVEISIRVSPKRSPDVIPQSNRVAICLENRPKQSAPISDMRRSMLAAIVGAGAAERFEVIFQNTNESESDHFP